MSAPVESSDLALLDLLRKHGPLSVAQLKAAMQVTATAVRQRLVRLLTQGDIQRHAERISRGRPLHRYGLTDKGRRRAGANFADLAIALWKTGWYEARKGGGGWRGRSRGRGFRRLQPRPPHR